MTASSSLLNTLHNIDGASPILADGKVGGNGCIVLDSGIVVTKSGKMKDAGHNPEDFVHVSSFSDSTWCCDYHSINSSILPTSDTPLYWKCLIEAPGLFNWAKCPKVSIHGHFLPSQEILTRLRIPIADVETVFSTREDADAMMELLCTYPYPEYKIFVRRGHGFFVLAQVGVYHYIVW